MTTLLAILVPILSLSGTASACEPPEVAVRAAEARKRFLNDAYSDALVTARQTIEGLTCADVLVPRSDLVELFQVAVAAASEVGDVQQARVWATTAASLLPGVPWEGDALGAAGAVYWNAAQATPIGNGAIATRGPVWVDGKPFAAGNDLTVPLGVHFVQEMDLEAKVRSSWIDVQTEGIRVGTASEGRGSGGRGSRGRGAEQESTLRPWLLGGGATLVGLGAVGMFLGAEDLYCAGQLYPEQPVTACEQIVRDYGKVTKEEDFSRLYNRGIALQRAGAAAVGLGVVTLAFGWTF